MNPLTQFKKILILPILIALLLLVGRAPAAHATDFTATPVIDWSNEARRAIVPAGPGGIFGSENYGNKFPGEAAVYLGIVHVAIYDAAVAIEGGYEPYAIALTAPPNTSSAAAIATAAHHTLVGCQDCDPPHTGLQPPLGLTPEQQAILDGDYADYLDAIPDGEAKTNGIAIGEQVAAAVVARARTTGGRGTRRWRTSIHRHPDPASGSEIPATPCRRSWAFAYPASRRSRLTPPRSSAPTVPML